ncbi:hypothetical protein [Afipia felis]|uniref:Uncharacterized protein n=2 Tax=Afipia felis TaxID=1035 RepID=A0A380WB19_AFIFE|nr:hypothetical protein [Afipia felis]EKS28840.1 hypothetical protein HMPREF9697_01368 [Afipia felis ATCC 53690]SUU77548.1 Uncharacterised protein [Afipia felis]SUU85613.1 Uncharacterised protein [Afipia felis]
MPQHLSADPAKHPVWSEHGAVANRRYSPVVRLGTVAFWTLIAGLLLARLLVADPNTSETTASTPQTQTTTALR